MKGGLIGRRIDWHRIQDAVLARRALLLACGAAVILAFCYLLTKLQSHQSMIDWDHFWYAGWLWNHGYNPYGPDFFRFRTVVFGTRGLPPFFVYPPHFWVIVAPMARLDDLLTDRLWGVINIALLLGGTWLWWRVGAKWRQAATLQAVLLLFVVCLTTGTGFALLVGQTSFVMWFALALMAFGIVGGARWHVSLALALLLLKPQFGLVMVIAYAAAYRDLRVLVGAGAMVAAGSFPTVLIAGPRSLLDFVHTITGWADFPFNQLRVMTGIGNLFAVCFGIEVSKQLLILAAAFGSAALLLLFPGRPEERDRRFLVVAIGLLALLVPLHVYDLFFIPLFPLILMPPTTRVGLAAAAIGLLLCVRPENIAGPSGPTVAVIGTLVLVVAAFVELPLLGRGARSIRATPDRSPA